MFAGQLTDRLIGELKSQPQSVRAQVRAAAAGVPGALGTLVGDLFPRRLADIGTRLHHCSGNFLPEAEWIVDLCVQNEAVLTEFVELKNEFENALLGGRFADASQILTNVRALAGFTVWEIENSLLIAEMSTGVEANREKLAELSAQASTWIPQALAYFFSIRAEQRVTKAVFEGSVLSTLRDLESDEAVPDSVISYCGFRAGLILRPRLDDRALANVLALSCFCGLVDRYEQLIRVLVLVRSLEETSFDKSKIKGVVERLGAAVPDRRTRVLAATLGSDISNDSPIDSSLLEILDLYTIGDYRHACSLAIAGVKQHPRDLQYYELWARSAASLGNGSQAELESVPPIQRSLLETLLGASGSGPGYERNVENLARWSYTLNSLDLGFALFSHYLSIHRPASPFRRVLLSAGATSSLTPRDVLAAEDTKVADRLMSWFEDTARTSATAALFSQILEMKKSGVFSVLQGDLPSERRLKYSALACEQIGDWERAASFYFQLLSEVDTDSPAALDAGGGLFRSLWSQNKTEECIAVAGLAYSRGQRLLSALELHHLVHQIQLSSDTLKPTLERANVLQVGSSEFPGFVTEEAVFDAYDDVLAAAGVDNASALRGLADHFERASLIYFLRFVAVPEVVDSSIYVASTDELESERISVLQLLQELDPEQMDEYSREISSLRKKSEIRNAIQTVTQSKIYIDTDGIRTSLTSDLIALYERFREVSSLTSSQRQVIPSVGRDVLIFALSDEAAVLARRIFLELRDRFVSSNEYGLDSYLSTRVRHGTLAGQLRNIFEREKLVTRLNPAGDGYEPNREWLPPHLGLSIDLALSIDSFSAVERELARFSATIDEIIADVRDSWIQIRTTDSNNNSAFFDFAFSDEEMFRLHFAFLGMDYESILDVCIEVLWERTAECLERLREAIRTDLLQRFTEALDHLREKADRLGASDLAMAVGRCRTAIQNELETVVAWFVVADEEIPKDFELEIAAETAVEIVSGAYSATKFRPETMIASSVSLPGWCLTHVLDLFQILLENVIKHSRPETPECRVCTSFDGKIARIVVENALPSRVALGELRKQLPDLQDRANQTAATGAIRREGGTGFYKLGRLLRHSLRLLHSNVEITITGYKWFRVEVSFEVEKLRAGGASNAGLDH